MIHESDMLLDRRRLARRLALWRAIAIVAVVAVALAIVDQFGGLVARDHVARLGHPRGSGCGCSPRGSEKAKGGPQSLEVAI